jgi:low affinity Fe/Cu permease
MDKLFAKFANATAKATGSPIAFLLCVTAVVIWAASGPIFKFSETWQLVINTGTTIITFLMVFLIQNTQNRDGAALQAKLDELILASTAENQFIGIEKLTDKELDEPARPLRAAKPKSTSNSSTRPRVSARGAKSRRRPRPPLRRARPLRRTSPRADMVGGEGIEPPTLSV